MRNTLPKSGTFLLDTLYIVEELVVEEGKIKGQFSIKYEKK
jgi:hypothetical protein